jgi:hypothetical protein
VRVAALGLVLCSLLLAASASADGDPASDYLIQQDVFLPYPPPPASASKQLNAAVVTVAAKGDRVKVAVIATAQDLGSVPGLFGQPQAYAKFLGTELAFVYKGPLLIVMPAGLGFYDNGAAGATLTGEHVSGSSAADLTTSAATVVGALERAGALHYKDTFKPAASVTPETGTAGKTLLLRYQAWDDSGSVRLTLQVDTAANRQLAAFSVPFRTVREGAWYGVPWKIPKKEAHQALVLCVRATDHAGNRSNTTCAKLSIH